jgi:hypothetical protein
MPESFRGGCSFGALIGRLLADHSLSREDHLAIMSQIKPESKAVKDVSTREHGLVTISGHPARQAHGVRLRENSRTWADIICKLNNMCCRTHIWQGF